VTRLTGAEELRVKESDRIQVMADGLLALGVDAQPTEDGIVIVGKGEQASCFTQAEAIESHHDHRIAMSFSVAALRAAGEIRIRECDNVATSFPNFVELAAGVGMNVSVFEG
jgi:3-phosphoshikimate 1-carboxyvinyltransferase